ncbi:MAG: DinB family protein [Candidatus Limnocylindria bacterium]
MAAIGDNGVSSVAELLADLLEARAEFVAALDAVDPRLLTKPGAMGEWSVRELIAHLGYWVGHAVEAIHAVEGGWAAEFEVGDREVDARNATVARIARETDLATVRAREEASFAALVERLELLDPSLLDTRLAGWGTLGAGIREDGAVHYREHVANLRALAKSDGA